MNERQASSFQHKESGADSTVIASEARHSSGSGGWWGKIASLLAMTNRYRLSCLSSLRVLRYLNPSRWTRKHLKIGPEVGRKTVVTTVALALVVTTFPIAAFLTAQPAKAAWYNDDWHYRKSILFTHSGSETNVYLNLSGTNALDTSASGKFQSDCGDLRFTDSTGKILPYYLVSGCGTATTVVHVLYASMPQGDQYLYVYYGNPSVANGTTNFDFATAATGVTFNSVGSEETSRGPVAEWKFDEGYGITAHDSTTNGFSGTVTGASWQDPPACVSGKCLYFNGYSSGNMVDLGNSTQLDPQNFTVSAWVRYTGATNYLYGTIFSNDRDCCGTYNGFHLYISNNLLRGTIWNGTATTIIDSTQFPDNQWVYVAFSYDGSQMKLYRNGVLTKSIPYSSGVGSPASYNSYIGTLGYSAGQYTFQGYIDEPAVYGYPRSLTQVQQDYNSGIQQMSQQQGNLSNGLVGYWKMDEASWNGTSGEVKDSSGNGNNGTAADGATTGAGKFGNGASLSGANDLTMPSGSSSSLNITGDFSLGSWIKTTSDNVGVISFGDNVSGTAGYLLGIGVGGAASGTLGLSASGNWMGGTSKIVNDGTWHFISVSFKNKKATFFVDGAAVGSATSSTNPVSWSGARALGARNDGAANFMAGTMDETRVYNRALSPNEIQQLYNLGPPPVAAYNFEEGSGATVNDVSGNGNTGTWSGTGSHWAAGENGMAGNFNGTDDSVAASNSASLDANSSYITVEGWIRPTSSTSPMVLSKGGTAGGWLIQAVLSGGNNQLTVMYKSGAANGIQRTSAGGVLKPNSWNHIAVLIRADTATLANNDIQIYVNGTLSQGPIVQNLLPTISTAKLKIGARGLDGSPQDFFTGGIDDVRIYNYARSQTQVLQDMNTGASPLNSPVGWWKMDEGQGTVIHNSGIAGSSLDGTASNTTWTNAGKNGSALNFSTASVSKVDVGTSVPVSASNPITVTAWVNMSDFAQYHSIFSLDFDWTNNKGLWVAIDPSSVTSKFFVEIGNGTGIYKYTSLIPSLNTWIQYSIVYDPINTRLTQYVNGQAVRTDTSVPQLVLASTHSAIGTDYLRGLSFNGKLDDVKVFSAALSSQDILADYNRAVTVKSGSVSTENVTTKSGATSTQPSSTKASEYCVPGDTSSCAGPVGEWKFEEGGGTTVADSSSNGNTGTWSGTGAHWIAGKIGKAGGFDGSDDYVSTLTKPLPLNTASFTVGAWVKTTSAAQQGVVTHYGGVYYLLGMNAGKAVLQLRALNSGTSYSVTSTSSINDGKWHYVTGVRDNAASLLRIYVDGIQQTTAADDPSGSMSVTGGQFEIGNTYATAFGYGFFNGSIDQARLYNYARTPAQVAWDFNKGGPVAEYKMDECSGATIHDASGNGLDGVLNLGAAGVTTVGTCLTSGTAWGNGASGKINGSMSFDGTDDYISTNVKPYTFQTIAGWVDFDDLDNLNKVDKYHYLFGTPYSFGLMFRTYTAEPGAGYFLRVDGTTANGSTNNISKVYLLPKAITGWHHIAASYDGNYVALYIDGKLASSSSFTDTGIKDLGRKFAIGANTDSAYYFDGQIDDVQIFNYALTPVQVATLYNGGSVRWGP